MGGTFSAKCRSVAARIPLIGRLVAQSTLPASYDSSSHYNCWLEAVRDLFEARGMRDTVVNDLVNDTYQRLRQRGEVWSDGLTDDGRIQLVVSDLNAAIEAANAVSGRFTDRLAETIVSTLADPTKLYTARSALIGAALNGNQQTIKVLIERPDDVKAKYGCEFYENLSDQDIVEALKIARAGGLKKIRNEQFVELLTEFAQSRGLSRDMLL